MATQSSELKDAADNGQTKDSLVFGHTSQGTEIHATLVRLARNLAVFEVYNPTLVLRASEALDDFKIVLRDRTVYAGRAVIGSMVNTGPMIVCEAILNDHSWRDVTFPTDAFERDRLSADFKEFVHEWQKLYRVNHEYKVVIADLQTFLSDLRLWLDQVELGIRSSPAADRLALENEIAFSLRDSAIPAINGLFDRFEAVADTLEPELLPAHRAFGKRLLHPLLLCAPFLHRTYTKPLGYAGDYEMINMIVRNGAEGSSLFAKLINAYLLDQAPPRAVRSRVGFLTNKIAEETIRVSRQGKTANIYSVACGPAQEVENFLAENALADQTQIRLLDFNEETLRYAGRRMDEAKKKHNRKTPVKLVKNSVQYLLKGNSKPASEEEGYDFIYCSGLYDYLTDRVCKMLNSYLYDRLLPGGLLVVGNFAPWTPRKNIMEHFAEWFLIYRDGRQLAALAPEQAPKDNCVVRAEPTGSNIFLEVRKPK
jgi:extracellular factor (EF) 3-hydroxypalmitic acid methyl ester biosynthesis protein